ncbi:hypothetical protein [Paraburkholderia ginsengisoli]|uniref:Uncharacterized protein n=1 Tax=Paraburkholderia ginsengisoli TaxID=311231 RepID=A0A7T4NA04_9BURK|nr:hypothetical protein [Paraburkholderia ginsengisoli]QQC67987.1 hypothetical protein I6I06_28845 [Paraburkholderia ginsengisoli]
MRKAEKHVMITAENVLASMKPAERCTLHDIARRVNGAIANVQTVLTECVARRAVRKANAGKRHVYVLVTAEEAAEDAGTPVWSQTILQGYDAANRRFIELCMVARSPVSEDQTVRYGVIGE